MTTNHKPATPLPWKVSGLGYLCGGGNDLRPMVRTVNVPDRYDTRMDLEPHDAAYIAHAANAYPTLIDALWHIAGYTTDDTTRAFANEILRKVGEEQA